MLVRAVAALLVFASVAGAAEFETKVSKSTLVNAAIQSANDNISSGWCGRGMLSILKSAGLGRGLQGGNGQDWEVILTKAGWKPVKCFSPEKAPLGSVLVYLGDARMGKSPRGTPGGYYGHVEMVALSPNGGRLYVADSPRVRPGGSVRDNFTGRAWMPPGGSIIRMAAPPIEDQVAVVLDERRKMAYRHFGQDPETLASLTPKVITTATTP